MDEKKLREAQVAFEKYKEEKKKIIDENLKLKGITKAKLYYPIVKIMLKAMMVANGERIYYLNEKNVTTPKGRTIIYAKRKNTCSF